MAIFNENDPCFQSSDFVTVAVLILRKHQLIRTTNDDPKRVFFTFARTPQLEKDVENLRVGKLLVDPTEFWAAERRAKQLIYDGQRNVV